MLKKEDYPLFLTPDQAADILQMSKQGVYRKIRSGKLPISPHGKPYRINRDKLWELYLSGVDHETRS